MVISHHHFEDLRSQLRRQLLMLEASVSGKFGDLGAVGERR
jgi:hypothetical protein